MESSALYELCDHLADRGPQLGRWSRQLAHQPQHGDLHTMQFFSISDFKLYAAAQQAGLPIPSYDGDDVARRARDDNALAAALTVAATLTAQSGQAHTSPHEVSGPSLGTVVGSIPAARMSDTIAEALNRQVGAAYSEAFGRMLHYLRRARVRRVDLRTAAALGFTMPGEPPRWLPVAPLGRSPRSPASTASPPSPGQ
ncbi:hypothetical protein OG589_17025 [Sphaerisporangium sp. NBC_01403]|uniref:hypothetical protein n=1 Tax=Sphaerisporangium sp. NBC_01403 TaxID=2903599 RepID=UPI00324857F5